MAKFKVTFTASREMNLKEIKELLDNHSVEYEEGDDLTNILAQDMEDNGIEFFSEEELTAWDHSATVAEVKK